MTVEKSGGFAGLIQTRSVDSKDLSANDAAMLTELLEHSGLYEASREAPAPSQPDRFQYTVALENAGEIRAASASEEACSPGLKALIDFVEDKSKPA